MACYKDIETRISNHARERMTVRSINEWQVEQVLCYGMVVQKCDAIIYAICKNEIKDNGQFLESCEGILVLFSSDDDTIMTTCRNHSMRKLRPPGTRNNRISAGEIL